LLAKKPGNRLGYKNQSQEVKSHKWFADIDWNALLEKKVFK